MTSAASESAELANSVAEANKKRYEEQVRRSKGQQIQPQNWMTINSQQSLERDVLNSNETLKVYPILSNFCQVFDLNAGDFDMLNSDMFLSYLLNHLQARERRERKKAEQKELREWERNKALTSPKLLQ